MRRFIVIAVAGVSLAGCSSLDTFKSAPPNVTVQLDSVPSGADARTSQGQSCKTPCSVEVPAAEGFSVSYTLANYQPLTVPVQVTRQPGDFTSPATTTVDPNPVVGELQPVTPSKPVRKKPRKRRVPKAATAPAASSPTTASPFPEPTAAPEPAAAPAPGPDH
ncbi:hypothetical protein [Nitrobacter sp. JJSN]|uniref:hypothetical protein n=1 Tax=Nitrobacter sp. JJSN TaxID=3453033 RepID=UPI003F75C4B5